MRAFIWPSIAFYCAFSTFVFYQQLHTNSQYRGSGPWLRNAVKLSTVIGMLTGLVYLIFYGWIVVWWVPFVVAVMGLIGTIVGYFVERVVGGLALSLAAFVGWPLCAYFMFKFLPR
jgi:hypothetical protein